MWSAIFQPSDETVAARAGDPARAWDASRAGDASRVGTDLRVARERLGWELVECAGALRIRHAYLAALEDGQFDALPGAAYAAGYLRSYGKALGLDGDELIRRFKAEAARGNTQTRLAFPVPAAERGLPSGAVVLLGAMLAVGVYVGWYRLSGEGRLPAEVVPAIPARLATLAEQVVPLSKVPPVALPAALGVVAGTIPELGDAPQMPAISPSSAAAAMPLPPVPAAAPPPQVIQAALPPPVQILVAPSLAAGLAPIPASDAPRLLLRAHGDAWLQVRDRSGQFLLRKILKAGESWPVPVKPGLLLNTGNADNTEILLDGNQKIALSGAGISRRDLPLDVELIKDGRLAPPVVMAKPRPAPAADPATTQAGN